MLVRFVEDGDDDDEERGLRGVTVEWLQNEWKPPRADAKSFATFLAAMVAAPDALAGTFSAIDNQLTAPFVNGGYVHTERLDKTAYSPYVNLSHVRFNEGEDDVTVAANVTIEVPDADESYDGIVMYYVESVDTASTTAATHISYPIGGLRTNQKIKMVGAQAGVGIFIWVWRGGRLASLRDDEVRINTSSKRLSATAKVIREAKVATDSWFKAAVTYQFVKDNVKPLRLTPALISAMGAKAESNYSAAQQARIDEYRDAT